MKLIKSTYIKGQNLLNFNFPISVYDKRSLLQLYAFELKEAPYFLNKINYINEPIERLKQMTSFLISQLYLSTLSLLSINPTLGETYQVLIGNMNCYFEQTKINPPTTNIYCFDNERLYKIYGYISLYSKTGINNYKIIKLGNLYIEYKNGQKYKIRYPTYYIGGLTITKCIYNIKDSALIIDETNRLISYILFNIKKKKRDNVGKYPDYFEGIIISLKEVKIDEKGNKHCLLENDSISLGECYGDWSKKIRFGDKMEFFKFELKSGQLKITGNWLK